jgi:CheY-like chemotaxis protein
MLVTPNSVLVVDDEGHIRSVVREYLSAVGIEVTCASGGEEALEVFMLERPTVVLTDVRMPGMDGIELLGTIKDLCPATAVIVMTGVAGEHSAVKILRAGAAYYIRKPFALADLERLVRKCLSWFEPDMDTESAYPFLEQESLGFRVSNDLAAVTPVVQFLWRRSRRATGDAFAIPFRCGLEEVVINAIEHGNLGIRFEEKARALAKNSYWELVGERAAQPEYRDRAVRLEYVRDRKGIRCRVTDEGDGFDWRKWCRPGRVDELPGANGRGIFLARIHFDGLSYNEAGNEATVTWDAPPGLSPKPIE